MSTSISLSLQESLYVQEASFLAIEKPRVFIEKILDVGGYIPIGPALNNPYIDMPLGVVRIGLGILDTIQFVARGSLCLIASLFSDSQNNRMCAYRFFYYSIHALGNIVRGAAETPFIPYLIDPNMLSIEALLLSKLLLLYYDYLWGRFKYPIEYLKPSTATPQSL